MQPPGNGVRPFQMATADFSQKRVFVPIFETMSSEKSPGALDLLAVTLPAAAARLQDQEPMKVSISIS